MDEFTKESEIFDIMTQRIRDAVNRISIKSKAITARKAEGAVTTKSVMTANFKVELNETLRRDIYILKVSSGDEVLFDEYFKVKVQ